MSLRQACMNRFEACGIVGCQRRTLWRTADVVENAPEAVKNAAGLIIGSHDTDAVVRYLYADYYGGPSVPME